MFALVVFLVLVVNVLGFGCVRCIYLLFVGCHRCSCMLLFGRWSLSCGGGVLRVASM